MDARVDRDAANGIDRRQVLARALGGAALLLAAACGKDSGGGAGTASSSTVAKKGTGKGRPQRPHDPIGSRPPGAKTSKRRHSPPQASASRSREPLPPDLQRYVLAKRDDGTLVASGKGGILHHPLLCKGHLGAKPPAGAPRRTGPPRLHVRYADGILYALVRAEPDAALALRLALLAAMTWPVSVRFADFAISALAKAGKVPDELTLVAALATPGTGGRGRGAEALRVLEARMQARKAPRRR